MKTTYVVLLSIDHFTKMAADQVQGKSFAGFKEFWKYLEKEISELTDEQRFIYTLANFAKACNEDRISMDLWYISFFNIVK